jgi:hypothetical protein
MRIEILRDTSIYGKPVYAGSIVDATSSDAHYLINIGKAKPAPIEEPKVKAPVKRKPRIKTNGNLPANA